jgi:hypothetical protein
MVPVLDAPPPPKRQGWPKGKPRKITRTKPARSHEPRVADDARNAGVAQPSDNERAAPMREENPVGEVRRVSRNDRQIGAFHVPKHLQKRGWDYQYLVITVYTQPVDRADLNSYEQDGGWRPVPASDMPGLASNSGFIETRGQRLYMRPMHLTQQAKQEDWEAAEQQKRDRVQGAIDGRVQGHEGISDIRGIRLAREATNVIVEGEVGVHGRG